ncbi:MAG: hypothetical protein WAS21_24890 [Geminicoccaceae bacterium]
MMFALSDSLSPAPSFPAPWHGSIRLLFARAARALRMVAVAGGAIAAAEVSEPEAATYNLILDPVVSGIPPYQLYPGARGTFEIPAALLGPANAGKLIPLSRFTRFDITVARHRFNLPGDLVLTTNSGLLLDANGQPLVFGSKRDPIAPEAIILDQDPDPPYPRSYAKLQFTNITSGTGRAWDYLDPSLRGPYASLKDGRYRIEGVPAINPAAPNIVIITHGLAPGGDFDHPGYLHHLAVAINDRLRSERIATTDTNIMEYEWPEAVVSPASLSQIVLTYKAEYTRAFNATEFAGNRLALKVKTYIDNGAKIKPGYNPNIHFIGHSLGSMVNAFAVRHLNKIRKSTVIKQFTILDDPLGVGYNDPTLRDICISDHYIPFYPENEKFFYDVLSTTNVKYVENFYATDTCRKTKDIRFGGPLPGAGPIDTIKRKTRYQGVRVQNTDHNTIHSTFYTSLIRSGVKIPGRPTARFLRWKSPVLPGWKPDIVWAPATASNIDPVIP